MNTHCIKLQLAPDFELFGAK
jgi:hypothetical protein